MDTGSEHSKKRDGAYSVFKVRPAKPPKYQGLRFTGVFLALLGGFYFLGNLGGKTFSSPLAEHAYKATHRAGDEAKDNAKDLGQGLGIFLLGGGLFLVGLLIDFRPIEHRGRRRFRVSAGGVEVDRRAFATEDIHSISVTNGMEDDHIRFASAFHLVKTTRVCYCANVETGGKAHFLAGGMDDTTAFGLMHHVRAVLKTHVTT